MENIKQFSTTKANLLFVEVPPIANRFQVFNDPDNPYLSYFLKIETERQYLPRGSWTLAGSIGEVKNDIANLFFTLDTIDPIEQFQSLCASINLLETNTQLLYELKN